MPWGESVGDDSMIINLIEKEENAIKVELEGMDEAMVYLITQCLLRDKKVEIATYSIPHPELDNPVLYVKTTDKNPKAALRRAVAAAREDFTECLEKFTGKKIKKAEEKTETKAKKAKKSTKKTTAKKKSSKKKGKK